MVIQITMFFTVLCWDYFNILAVIGKLSFPMMKENPSMFIYIVVNMNDWNKIIILKGNVKTRHWELAISTLTCDILVPIKRNLKTSKWICG